MLASARACLVVVLLALSAASAASRAAAEAAPTYALHWVRGEGAEQCASGQQLALALEQLLGPVLRPASEARLAIEGSVTRVRAERWALRIRVIDGEGAVLGERALSRDAKPCSALTPSILLVLALMIDPEAVAHGFPAALLAQLSLDSEPERTLLSELTLHPPMPQPLPVVQAQPATQTASLPPRAPAKIPAKPASAKPAAPLPAAASAWAVALKLGAGVDALLLPRVAAGANLGVDVSMPHKLLLALQAYYWAPVPVDVAASDGDKRVRFSAAHAQLALCLPLLTHSALHLGACLGGVLGLRWVDASELQQSQHTKRVYAGPLVALGFQYDLTRRWFVGADVTGALLWPHDRFTYQDELDRTVALFQPGWGSVWAALNVGVRL